MACTKCDNPRVGLFGKINADLMLCDKCFLIYINDTTREYKTAIEQVSGVLNLHMDIRKAVINALWESIDNYNKSTCDYCTGDERPYHSHYTKWDFLSYLNEIEFNSLKV